MVLTSMMEDFTYAKKADMHYMYGRANGNDSAALRMCHAQFPDRRKVDHRILRKISSHVGRNQTTVMRICDRWMEEGTMDRRGQSHLSLSLHLSVPLHASIAWSTLDAELQTSPPPMVRLKKDVGGRME
ncbi:hypothetical protein TNCV_2764651 [Trichonephila clavipes]|nr:hypothetical protein TNCV_2764651 [Trichonephila clavipes]